LRRLGLLSVVVFAAVASQPLVAQSVNCRVSSITDGDTFRCSGGRRVRLLLIDAPERGQGPYAARATEALGTLVAPGDRVRLEMDVQHTDRYGRTLAYVYLIDGRMVNEEMARLGFVVILVYPPNVAHVERLRAAVAEAQAAKRGLWSTRAFECLPVDRRRRRC
jgi:micrococcal nuclease